MKKGILFYVSFFPEQLFWTLNRMSEAAFILSSAWHLANNIFTLMITKKGISSPSSLYLFIFTLYTATRKNIN